MKSESGNSTWIPPFQTYSDWNKGGSVTTSGTSPAINTQFQSVIAETSVTYLLRGVLYYGDNHFTCRIVSEDGMTWFHDGIATGKNVICEGHVNNLHTLASCLGKQASIAIYTLRAN
jgi:hypothetical protein